MLGLQHLHHIHLNELFQECDVTEEFLQTKTDFHVVKVFLEKYPDATVRVDKEWFAVYFEKSGFRQHPNSSVIYHTKSLVISLDYEGKPAIHSLECGGPISLSIHDMDAIKEHLQEHDWCFPYDQSEFAESQMRSDLKDLENQLD